MAVNKKDWTLMVYMAGDNNLSEEMIRGIIELRNQLRDTGTILTGRPGGIGDKNNVNFIVEFDGQHPFVNTRRYNLTYDTTPRPHRDVDDLPPEPTNSQSTVERHLERFVKESIRDYPAEHYALIISGHGDAFLGKTLLLDQDADNVASIRGVADAIKNGLVNLVDKKLDILGFDSCLMNSIEVVYEFRDVAKTIIGSQGEIPNFSWDYARIGQRLMEERSGVITTEIFVKHIKESIKEYNRNFAFGGRSIDFCSIETSKLNDLSRKFDFLGLILGSVISKYAAIKETDKATYIGSHVFQLLLKTHWNCQSYLVNQSVDIGDFSKRLASGSEDLIKELLRSVPLNPAERIKLIGYLLMIREASREIADELGNVVRNGLYVGADFQFSNGLSMFFPWSFLGFVMSLEKYRSLKFTDDFTSWTNLIATYTFLTSRSRPDFDPSKIPAKTQSIFDNLDNFLDTPDVLAMISSFLVSFPLKKTFPSVFSSLSPAVTPATLFGNISITDLNDFLLQPLFNTKQSKFNPPNSKGLDNYLYHFGKTNNIFPNLNIEDEFPPNDGTPDEIQD